jgi:hypothetical protein
MEEQPNGNTKLNMQDRLRKSRERVEELTAETKAKARRAVRITDNYAHDHPWRMVTTAAALAFISGMLVHSSTGRRKNGPRVIVRREIKQPVIKVKEKKQGKFELIHALIPLIALGIKAMSVARSHPNAHHGA